MEQGVHAHQGSGGRVLPALQHCLPCLSPTQQPTGPTLISAPLPHWYCCEVMASTAAHSSTTPHTWWTGAEAEQEQDAEEEHPAVHGSAAAKFGALQALQRAAAAARNLQNLDRFVFHAGLWALTGWDIPHSGWSPSAMKKSLPPGMKHTWPRFTSIVLPSYGGSCSESWPQSMRWCVEAATGFGKAAAAAVRTRLLGLACHGA